MLEQQFINVQHTKFVSECFASRSKIIYLNQEYCVTLLRSNGWLFLFDLQH